MKNNQTHQESCQYLGLSYDQATYSNFPSAENVCYHVQPPASPAFSHQNAYCLTNQYTACPVYTSPEGIRLPRELQHQPEKKTNKKILLVLGFCIVIILGILFGIYWNNNRATATISLFPSPTNASTIGSTAIRGTITRAATNTRTLTPTELSSTPTLQVSATQVTPSPTPTEVRDFRLDQAIGENPQFIIHRTIEGESLPLFANIYQTSVEAIRAVNYNLPRILWPDQIVIIPLNQTDMSGIPPLIAYENPENGITFEQIAEDLDVPLEKLLQYNNINEEYPLQQGDWILIPQMGF